jgi:FixJ family two-component response regulator
MQNTKNPLIFIVEDSVVYKDLIVGYLESKKFKNIKTYKNGEACLKDLHLKPDIIVLDYSYEGINGLEFMQKVRMEHPAIDFIFLSGQSDVQVAVEIMKLGAADYIEKNEKAPYRLVHSIEHLLKVIKKEKVRKGINIGVVGFFMMLFLIIMTITLLSIFFKLEL